MTGVESSQPLQPPIASTEASQMVSSMTKDEAGNEIEVPLVTVQQVLARTRERKAKSTLLMAISDEHLARFHRIQDAKTLWAAIKTRFGESTNSTNELNTAYIVSTATGHSSQAQGSSSYADELMFLFFANQSDTPQTDKEDLKKIDQDDLEEIDLKWQISRNSGNKSRDARNARYRGRDNGEMPTKEKDEKTLVVQDGLGTYDWSYQVEEDATDFAHMDFTSNLSSSSSNSKLDKALKEKEDLKAKLEKFETSSKNLTKLLDSQISAKVKIGLGYDSQFNEKEVLDIKEEEVTETVFDNRLSDEENSVANDRFKKGEGYHAVPPPLTRNYLPPKPDMSFARLDDSIYKFKISETVTSLTKDEKGTPETSTFCVEKSKEDRFSAPLIEDWETDSDDDSVFTLKPIPAKIDFVKAGESVKHVKPIESVKHDKPTTLVKTAEQTKKYKNFSSSPKVDKKFWKRKMTKKLGLGFGFTKKACFVCGSFSHLIKDSTFLEDRMAKKFVLPTNVGKGTGHRESRLVWNNVQRINHQNKFAPTTVFIRVNTAGSKAVSVVNGNGVTAIKTSAGCVWRPRVNAIDQLSKDNRWICTRVEYGHPQQAIKDKGIVDSGCSRHMAGNKAYLADYQEIHDGGFVAFCSSRGKAAQSPLALVTKTQNKTPYELLNGRTTRLDFMRPFGCHVIILNTLDPLGKFEGKADEGFLVGYSVTSKAFRVFNTKTTKVAKNLHGNQTNKNAGSQDTNGNVGTQDNVNAGKEVSIEYYIVFLLWSSISPTYKSSDDKPDKPKDHTEKEASDVADALRKEFKQGCMDQRGVTKAGNTNSFNTISNPVNAASTSGTFSAGGQSSPHPDAFIQTRGMAKKSSGAHALVSYIHKKRRTNHQDYEYCLFACLLSQMEPKKGKRSEEGIFISQDKYVAEILKKFDFSSVKTASTPKETQKPLVQDEVTPKLLHLQAVKRIFRYLKGKLKLGLKYPRDSPFDLEAYLDSDYAGENLDRKSITGGCQFIAKRLISWQCKKQTIGATSTTKAEYVDVAHCYGQVLWIQNQMLDYGFNFMNTKIYIDNESTICIVKNPVYHLKTKHIEIRHHLFRDSYEKKLIQMKLCTASTIVDAAELNLKFVDQHNMVACLEKTEENTEFCQIVDFLSTCSINYALTVSPTFYASYIEQFWNIAISVTVNSVKQIHAIVDGKVVVISESSVRSDLLFNDEDGIACLTNAEIFENLALMGYEQISTKLTFQKG
uniref:Putative ribonuclease H-like domain-containing protein n=1 Tax=Tanacetum cinerariifolium TaxID=118510 RepID=A0A6L2N8N2_TANCI|nr:putative ribonuclease H-like domain-containing protein [Tanacetum cinerariifolium]